MHLPSTFEELVAKANSLNLYQKLLVQLNKDLLYANIDLEFDQDTLPTSLRLVLQETVYHLLNEKFSDYLNLLYIIDVSEQKVLELDGHDTFKLSEDITLLVLLREWEKVWYREKFK